VKGLEAVCEVEASTDGADALLKVVDAPAGCDLCDYKMPGLDGSSSSKNCAARESTRTFHFCSWPAGRTSRSVWRPLVDGVEDFITKPFLIKICTHPKKSCGSLAPRKKLQKKASRREYSGDGWRDEHDRPDAVAGDGEKSCRLIVRQNGAQCELYFASGSGRRRENRFGGRDTPFKSCVVDAGEFESISNAANASTKRDTTRNTTAS